MGNSIRGKVREIRKSLRGEEIVGRTEDEGEAECERHRGDSKKRGTQFGDSDARLRTSRLRRMVITKE